MEVRTQPAPSPGLAGDATVERAAPSGFIHLGVAREICPILSELGCDPERVIEGAELDPSLFDHADSLVSLSALGKLLRLGVERTHCSHLGLLVGRRSTLKSLRAVGALMRHSETIGDALRNMNSHLRVQNRTAVTQLDVDGDVALLSYLLYHPTCTGAIQILDGALATACQILRELGGPRLEITEVLLPRRPPIDPEPYRQLFRAPVRFNQEVAALVFPAEYLKHSVEGADPVIRRALEFQIAEWEHSCPADLKDEMRRLLRAEFLNARSSSSEMAELLSVHRRTLNRRLKAEGTTFKSVADEIRFGIACQLLEDTDLRLVEIAAALHFSEPAAFTRAFRRWSGTTPSNWRAHVAAQVSEG
ncbi:AraC family transcriptional regulator [Enterovirga sp.]|uniref:AraC family transcriptional regulator n=1 Tax=Enterovirga sp. TaxID=2026350 RepID=UPI002B5E30D7|nr:AraC family transcriptional regulator [Enterovirga sp.]HMO27790.1 AraC family transcriptional regulator [Enterovirga sp.]